MTAKQMTTWLTTPLGDRPFPIILIDGIVLGDHTVLIARAKHSLRQSDRAEPVLCDNVFSEVRPCVSSRSNYGFSLSSCSPRP